MVVHTTWYMSNITYAKYYADSYLPPLTPSKKMKNGRVSRVMNQPASCTLASGAGKYLHGDAESEMICDMATKGFEIRSTMRVCCVLCDCVLFAFVFVFVFVSRTFVYICIYRSLISFIYVSLTGRPQRLRSRARSCTFRIFF